MNDIKFYTANFSTYRYRMAIDIVCDGITFDVFMMKIKSFNREWSEGL